jgi:hypothetical protein
MAVRRGLVGLLAVLALELSFGARATAEEVFTTPSPVIWVNLGGGGSLTIRTWDRSSVQIEGDPTIQYNHPHAPEQKIAEFFSKFLLRSQTVNTPQGPLTLPAEDFPIPPLSPQPHDAVIVRGEGDVTITIPENTAIVEAQVSQGEISIEGYRNGTILAQMGAGSIHLTSVGGTVAVQLNNGPFIAQNSSFDRIRVRTGRGSQFFSDCHATQIQSSSLTGTIVYDNGTFEPGLARFESQRGSVAIGVSDNNVQFLAHSDAGKIFSGPEVNLTRSGNDAQAALSRSGPVVSASSSNGSVIFYRGQIAHHPELREMLRPRGGAQPSAPRPPKRRIP